MNVQGLYRNARNNKVPVIAEIMREKDCIYAVITESHLSEEIKDAEIHIAGYTPFRQDRQNRIQGGVIMYIKDDLAKNSEVIYKHCNRVVECMAMHIKQINCVIIGIYRPPDCKLESYKYVLDDLEKVLKEIPGPTPDIHFMGDFNFPFLMWDQETGAGTITSGSTLDEQAQAKCTLSFAENHLLVQNIFKPTRINNILDLCFTNNTGAYHSVNVHSTSISDHNIIISNTMYNIKKTVEDTQKSKLFGFQKYNFFSDEADWSGFNKMLENTDWDNELHMLDVNQTLKYVNNIVMSACEKFIPKRKVGRKKSNIPTYPRRLMKRRCRINQRLTHTHNESTKLKLTREKYDIEKKLRDMHYQRRKQEEEKATAAIKVNSKYFFSYAKKYSTIPTTVGPLIDNNGGVIGNLKSICEIFRQQYESVFSVPHPDKKVHDPIKFFNTLQETNLHDIEFSETDIIEAINELKLESAHGPDGFPSIVLKRCSKLLAHPLCILWRKSLDSGIIPSSLKEATITPIFKGGNISKGFAKNYRPIALTSHVIKIFEKVIRKSVVKYLERNNCINCNQHGFRAGRSCLSQLLAHYDFIINKLEKGNNVDVIYLDFAKAFDKVDHGILLHKLRDLGITGKIGSWIHSFLTNRYQYVSVNKEKSMRSSVLSGVPQGTVLGPLLFLVLIGDIDSEKHHCFVSSFADDTRCAAGVKCQTDQEQVQKDLETIYAWSRQNNMQFNNDKFERLAYGNNEKLKTHAYMSADSTLIPNKNDTKDLGIKMSASATFSLHITQIVDKASKLASWILRTFISREQYVMLTLWKSLVLPRMEYNCPLWNPVKIGEIKSIEAVQRTFTSKIAGMETLNYWERLAALNLYSLQRRRDRYDAIYIWKMLENKVPNIASCRQITIAHTIDSRNGRKCTEHSPMKTACCKVKTLVRNSFPVRAVKTFNVLPQEIRNMTGCDVATFKTKLDRFLASIPDEPPTPGYHTVAESNSLLHQVPLVRRSCAMKPVAGSYSSATFQ